MVPISSAWQSDKVAKVQADTKHVVIVGRTQGTQPIEGAVDLDEVALQQVLDFFLCICIRLCIVLCLCAWRAPPCSEAATFGAPPGQRLLHCAL